jgi:hypothetical protein
LFIAAFYSVMAGHSQSEGRRRFARLCPGHPAWERIAPT